MGEAIFGSNVFTSKIVRKRTWWSPGCVVYSSRKMSSLRISPDKTHGLLTPCTSACCWCGRTYVHAVPCDQSPSLRKPAVADLDEEEPPASDRNPRRSCP